MVKVKLKACGGTGVEGHETGEIEMDMCDFMLTVERSNGSKRSYRLDADRDGNLIIDTVSIDNLRLISNNGYPALVLYGKY